MENRHNNSNNNALFSSVRNEDSPVLARSFGKTDWTKPRFVTKPYADARRDVAPAADVDKVDLKVTVLSKIIYDHFTGVKRIGDLRLVSKLIEHFKVNTNVMNEKLIPNTLNATTSRSNDEEKLTQKIEVISEVSLVEAEPKSDVLNPPQTLGPSVMTFEDIKADSEAEIYDAIALQLLHAPINQIDDYLLKELEKVSSKNGVKSKTDELQDVVKYEATETTCLGRNVNKGISDAGRTATMATPKPDVEEDNPEDENTPEVLEPTATKANPDKKVTVPTSGLANCDTVLTGKDYMVLVDLLRKKPNSAMFSGYEPQCGMPASDLEARNPGCMPPSPHHFGDKSKQVPLTPNINVKPKGPCPSCKPLRTKEPQKKFAKINADNPIASALQLDPLMNSPKTISFISYGINPHDSIDIKKLTDIVKQKRLDISNVGNEEPIEGIDILHL